MASMDDGDTIIHPHPSSSEIVIFTHLSNSEDVNGTSQQNNLLNIPQQNSSTKDNETIADQPKVQANQIDHCNDFVGGLNKMVKGIDNVELYLCEKCNRTFKQKSRYERHIANHPSEKHYLCETCNKTFTRMSHLEKHIRTHTEERRHVCEICGAAFILPHHLVRHSLIHSGDRPFKCDVCNKTFTRKAGLTQHQFLHTGIRPYVCFEPSCGKQFTDRTTLRRHLLTHSREKPFICKECDKTFRTKAACRKHYLRHFKGEDSFKCGVCEEMFKNEKELKVHAETHDEKRRTGAYRCGFCLRVFRCQDDLDAHVPLHESGLMHACQHCTARFYTQEDLLNHISKHSENDSAAVQPLNSSLNNPNNSPEKLQSDIKDEDENNQVNDMNKVLVVLQLPPTLNNLKDNQGLLQVQNIQQLLGTARIEKLVVTTDPIINSSQTVALELSQDQQESIQNILQTTNIIPNDITSSLASINDVVPTDSSLDDLTSHDTLGPEDLSNSVPSSPFVLKTLPHQPVEKKPVSQYLIVPPTGNFTSVDNKPSPFQTTNFDTDTSASKMKISKIGSPTSNMGITSVFKPPMLPVSQIVHPLQILLPDGIRRQQNSVPNFTGVTNESETQTTTIAMADLAQSSVRNGKVQTTTYFDNTEYENTLDGGLTDDFIVPS